MSSRRISDEDLLTMFEEGILKWVNFQLLKWHRSRKCYQTLKPVRHPNSGRYRYNLRFGERNRTLYRNRLVWMISHMQVIPEGYDVAHRNHDNTDDRPENLFLQRSHANQSDNIHKGFTECMNFFTAKTYGSKGDF